MALNENTGVDESESPGSDTSHNLNGAINALLIVRALDAREAEQGFLSPEDAADRQRIKDEVRKRAESLKW